MDDARSALSEKLPRFWFYKPTLWWYGWETLRPFWFGGDEWGRRTIVLGWNLFGQLVIPFGKPDPLGDPFASSPTDGPGSED